MTITKINVSFDTGAQVTYKCTNITKMYATMRTGPLVTYKV